VARDLEAADRPAERGPLARVVERLVEHALGAATQPAAPISRSPWSSHMMW
jgi:hypothetical protein